MISTLSLLSSGLLGCVKDAGLTTFNNEPEAVITSHADGDSVDEGMPTLFQGSLSDPDHATEDLEGTWYLGTEVLCPASAPDEDGKVSCEVALGVDDTELRLEVKDPMDAVGSDTVSLTDAHGARGGDPQPESSGVFYSDQAHHLPGVVSDGEVA